MPRARPLVKGIAVQLNEPPAGNALPDVPATKETAISPLIKDFLPGPVKSRNPACGRGRLLFFAVLKQTAPPDQSIDKATAPL